MAPVKTATLDELRATDLSKEKGPILVEEQGRTLAVVYSLAEPETLPLDVKRQLFVEFATELGDQLDRKGISEDEILRDFAEFRKRRRGR